MEVGGAGPPEVKCGCQCGLRVLRDPGLEASVVVRADRDQGGTSVGVWMGKGMVLVVLGREVFVLG